MPALRRWWMETMCLMRGSMRLAVMTSAGLTRLAAWAEPLTRGAARSGWTPSGVWPQTPLRHVWMRPHASLLVPRAPQQLQERPSPIGEPPTGPRTKWTLAPTEGAKLVEPVGWEGWSPGPPAKLDGPM